MQCVLEQQQQEQQKEPVAAAGVVEHLHRVEAIEAAVQESLLRRRVCVTKQSLEAEDKILDALSAQGRAELRAATRICCITTDAPLLKSAATQAVHEAQGRFQMLVQRHEEDVEQELKEDTELMKMIMAERHREMAQIEADVRDLKEIGDDLNVLVMRDAEAIETVEEAMERIKADTNTTVEQLEEALKHEKARRKKKVWLVIGGVVVVLTLGLALLLYRRLT